MKFTIIVPVYNAEDRITKCLDSILEQDFEDYEVILINDGSTDNSLQYLYSYCSKDSRFHVYSFENSGVGMTRKRGVILAQGDYVLFIDSDDTYNSKLLSSLSPFVIDNNIDVIRYQCNIINDKKGKNHERYNIEPNHSLLSGLEVLNLWSVPGKKYAVYWLFCFKRELLLNSFFIPNLRCYEDVAVIPLLILYANSVITIDYIGYNYIQNTDSLTNIKSLEAEISRAKDFISAYDYFVENIIKLAKLNNTDRTFFINDYNRRLLLKYNSLPENLQKQFYNEISKRITI